MTKLLAALAACLTLTAGCGRDRANIPRGSAAETAVKATEVVLREFVDSPLSPVPAYVRDEPVEETDCSGLLSAPELGSSGRLHVRRTGRFAAGSMVGSSFTPMIYFSTLADARKCAGGLDVREWSDKKAWVAR